MEIIARLANLPGALPGACAQGLIWGIMAIGVYLTYRILDVADLTVDGSFGTGGAVCVMCLLSGWVKKEDVCKVCLLLLASFRQIFERKVDQSFDNYSRLFLYKFEESYCVVLL